MPLARLLTSFQLLSPLPTNKLGPSGADSQVGGFVYILGPCESLQETLLWGWEFYLPLKVPQVFIAWGFEVSFPCTATLGWEVHLAPQLFLPVYPHTNVELPGPPAAASLTLVLQMLPCPVSSLPPLPISTCPVSLSECFFFNSLVVRLPKSSVFWQFSLFFFLSLSLSFFWLCEEAKCIYLRLHLGWKF